MSPWSPNHRCTGFSQTPQLALVSEHPGMGRKGKRKRLCRGITSPWHGELGQPQERALTLPDGLCPSSSCWLLREVCCPLSPGSRPGFVFDTNSVAEVLWWLTECCKHSCGQAGEQTPGISQQLFALATGGKSQLCPWDGVRKCVLASPQPFPRGRACKHSPEMIISSVLFSKVCPGEGVPGDGHGQWCDQRMRRWWLWCGVRVCI